MEPTSPIAAVVVHWNQGARCRGTIERLRRQGVAVEITVIDNGSTAEHLDRLRPIAGIELVELGENRGFGPAANVGLRRWLERGVGEWAVVVPHDAEPTDDLIVRMLRAVHGEGAVGMVSADVGDQARPIVDPYLGAVPGPSLGRSGFEPADYAHGTFLMLRREFLTDVGLFDERYFAYNEEADLGLRGRRRGWSVGIVRGAMVANPLTSSGDAAVDYLMQRNTLLLLRTHFGRWPALFRFGVGVVQLAVGMVRPTSRAPWFSAGARRAALWDTVRGRYGPPGIAVRGPGGLQPRPER